MEKIEHLWWPTPVWEIQTDFNQEFNENLLSEMELIKDKEYKNSNGEINILHNIENSPELVNLNTLKKKILEIVTECARPHFHKGHPEFFKFLRSWVNDKQFGESIKIHSHGGSLIAATYYIKTPPNCGNLILIDPLGGVNFGWTINDKGHTGFRYKEIIPKEGKLVFFPGHLLHMTEENKSHDNRISITSNIS